MSGAAVTEATLRRLAANWAYRARLEHEATRRFARLAGRMALCGVDARLVTLAERASADETRHVAVCAALAEACGAPVALDAAPAVSEVAPRLTGARDRVLYEVVAFCCVTETSNASLLAESLAHATDRRVRAAVRAILRDEVAHARLGWAFLHRHPPDERQAAWLARRLPDMLDGTIREDLFDPVPLRGDEARAAELGSLPLATRRAVFVAALEQVLFPGLEAFGVSPAPARAWLAARLDGALAAVQ